MLTFIFKRLLLMIPTVVIIAVISFIIIELPPGDFVTSRIMQLEEDGVASDDTRELAASLRARYGLDKPWFVRFVRWFFNFIRGEFGYSFAYNQRVNELIGERLALTVTISLASLLFVWVVAFPIGIYSAVRQYSPGDYVFTFLGFLGLATPNFLLALILMFFSYKFFGTGVGGLFSPQYFDAPWSFGKVFDLLKHLFVPMVVVGTAGTAGTIRIMRANLLDELRKAYVITARSKGLGERFLLFKYPVRVALNPFISTVGWVLPGLISGAVITAVVLALPTAGPLFLEALQNEDMYLAGSFVMLTATLTVIGTLLSDILLAIVDPRIRCGQKGD